MLINLCMKCGNVDKLKYEMATRRLEPIF